MRLLLLSFVGCLSALSGGPDGPGPEPAVIDENTTGSPIGQAYGLQKNPSCEDWTDPDGTTYEIPGATSWFIGEFGVDGDKVEGFEYWVLYPNQTWAAADSTTDCQVAWYATGEVVDGACGGCDYRLDLHMSLEIPATNCPDDFVDSVKVDAESFDVQYDVRISGDTARFSFSGSGNDLGTGPATSDTAFAYVTDRTCKWF